MSGKGSRERRVRAVRRAREDVYANRGGPMGTIPFDCLRQAGIYSAAYEKDLNVRGMSKNERLSRAVSDAGFGMFRQQIGYKCERYGTRLVVADRWYPGSKSGRHPANPGVKPPAESGSA